MDFLHSLGSDHVDVLLATLLQVCAAALFDVYLKMKKPVTNIAPCVIIIKGGGSCKTAGVLYICRSSAGSSEADRYGV